MAKKKRKYHKEHDAEQSSELHYGTWHESPAHACEQKGKSDLGEREALTRKKRRRDKAGQPTHQQATEISAGNGEKKVLVGNDAGVRNEVEQHVGAMEQRSRKEMDIIENCTGFLVCDDVAMLPQAEEKKKKKKKKKKKGKMEKKEEEKQTDQGVHDPLSVDHAEDGIHISDEEDDMLFNFSTEPSTNIIEHRGLPVNSNRNKQKEKIFLETDETTKKKEKKKKTGEEADNSLSSDHHHQEFTRDTAKDDMADTTDYKSPVVVNKYENSFLRKEKNEVFTEPKGLKVDEKKEVTADEEGTPEKIRSERTLTESRPTFSLAVAGSIVDNAQSLQLATMLAGQIARAATIFRVDEALLWMLQMLVDCYI